MPAPTAWLLTASLALAAPQTGPGVGPLQPATHRSASGVWSLQVDPTSPLGAGAADVRVANAEGTVWQARLPLTLRGACIDDTGRVAGYAYDQGWNGVAPVGDFVIAVLSPAGDVVAQHAWPTRTGRGIHSAPTPRVMDLVHDPEHGTVLFRVVEEDRDGTWEAWRVVDLASGALVHSFRTQERADWDDGRAGQVVDVALLPGTGCYAICWRLAIDGIDPAAADMRISVVGPDGRPRAALDFAGELRSIGYAVWSRGTLRDATGNGRFDLWLPASRRRAQLVFDADANELRVLATQAWVPETDEVAAPGAETDLLRLRLPALAETELCTPQVPEAGPIRDVVAFGIAGPGTLQIVRLEDREEGIHTSLVLDEDGGVLGEREFGPVAGERLGRWWSLGDGRWLAWPGPVLCDTRLGTAQALRGSGFRSVAAAEGLPDGGFVVLGEHATFAGVRTALAAYDAAGARRWLVHPSCHDADDVSVAPDGRIALICPWSDALETLDGSGVALASFDLAELWGRDPSYPCRLRCDGDGGYLVVESASATALTRVAADGTELGSVEPRAPDGSTDTALARNVEVAADGALWTTDGRALFRLAADGSAERVLGRPRAAELLADPRQAAIDGLGRLLIRDAATRAVHVFDRFGARLHVAEGLPGDFVGRNHEGRMAVDGEGGLHLSTEAFEEGWVAFDAQGARLGPVDLGGRTRYVPYGIAFVPGTSSYWRFRAMRPRECAVRCDLEGNELARIDRRPDGRWFERLSDLSVDPAGRVAVLEETPHSGAGEHLLLYDASGEPQAQYALPPDLEAIDVVHGGRWVALPSYDREDVLLVAAEDGSMRWVRAPSGWDAKWGGEVGFSPNGAELWFLRPSAPRLWRFALP